MSVAHLPDVRRHFSFPSIPCSVKNNKEQGNPGRNIPVNFNELGFKRKVINWVHLATAEVFVLQTTNKASECLFKNGQNRSGIVLGCFCVI